MIVLVFYHKNKSKGIHSQTFLSPKHETLNSAIISIPQTLPIPWTNNQNKRTPFNYLDPRSRRHTSGVPFA